MIEVGFGLFYNAGPSNKKNVLSSRRPLSSRRTHHLLLTTLWCKQEGGILVVCVKILHRSKRGEVEKFGGS